MRDDEKLKIQIHYGGFMSKEGKKLCYKGGSTAPDMLVDPDFLTFNLFEDFSRDREQVVSDVDKLWYRLPSEDMSVARLIWKDKDTEIMKMALEAKECGEVYIYIEHSVSPPNVVVDKSSLVPDVCEKDNAATEECLDDGENADDENGSDREEEESEESDGEEREEESDDEEVREEKRDEEDHEEEGGQKENREKEEEVQSEDENQILGKGAADSRFENLFALAEIEVPRICAATTIDDKAGYDSEVEVERLLPPGEYPDSPEDTDEEWANWQKKDNRGRPRKEGKSKGDYDKPPYLWLMQTFNNGDEFKDQLLRYVLKTQYDVKLNKWHPQKHAAVCTHEKCKWRIYCSMEKPIRKWMVKVYEDMHNHLPTGRARMLKQGTIARLFKEEARRRPEIRSCDIKDELMHMYKISVSIFKCRKARRIALDMALDTQRQQFAKLWDYEAVGEN